MSLAALFVADSGFFRDFAFIFVAALAGGLVARLLRQPLIVGYVLGGILVGPFTPGPTISDLHFFELLAELGVILLMYSIGIEFSIKDLLRVKWVAVIGGPLGILLSLAISLGLGTVLGWSVQQSIAVGGIVSVASTMVLTRVLIERGELQTEHGRIMVGITLVEDLAVVVMTVLLPSIGSLGDGEFSKLGIAFVKAAAILIPVSVTGFFLVPRLMSRVARTQSQELYLLVALALGFATAALTEFLGLSLALGAFLAGMLISESEHAHKVFAQVLPLRDAFVALFFVTIGALINPAALWSKPALLGSIVALVVAGKFVVWSVIVLLFRYGFRTALIVGAGLTQIGEFSFVLAQVARGAQLIGDEVYNATLATSLISILINVILVKVVPVIVGDSQSGKSLRAA